MQLSKLNVIATKIKLMMMHTNTVASFLQTIRQSVSGDTQNCAQYLYGNTKLKSKHKHWAKCQVSQYETRLSVYMKKGKKLNMLPKCYLLM